MNTMLAVALVGLGLTSQDALTSRDVGQIVTVSVQSSVEAMRAALGSQQSGTYFIEAARSNGHFEALAGRSLPIDSAAWLPAGGRVLTSAAGVTACPSGNARLQQCRLTAGGVLLSIVRVAPAANGELEVHVQLLRNPESKNALQMEGSFAELRVAKVNGVWRARVVGIAAS